MGYHYEDFFNDHIIGKLYKLVSGSSENKSEEFIKIMQQIIHDRCGNMLSERLLHIMSVKEGDDPSTPYDAMYNLFTQLYPDYDIRKLEYATDDGTVVSTDYHGADDKL